MKKPTPWRMEKTPRMMAPVLREQPGAAESAVKQCFSNLQQQKRVTVHILMQTLCKFMICKMYNLIFCFYLVFLQKTWVFVM